MEGVPLGWTREAWEFKRAKDDLERRLVAAQGIPRTLAPLDKMRTREFK